MPSQRKKCPFCAKRKQTVEHLDGIFHVVCVCTAQGPSRRTAEEALDAWNTRRKPSGNGTPQDH